MSKEQILIDALKEISISRFNANHIASKALSDYTQSQQESHPEAETIDVNSLYDHLIKTQQFEYADQVRTIARFRSLVAPIKSNPGEQLYRFVKASERLPDDKYKSDKFLKNDLGYWVGWYNADQQRWLTDSNQYFEKNDVEWLEPVSIPSVQEDAVELLKFIREQGYEWSERDSVWFRHFDDHVTDAQLYDLFKQQNNQIK